MSRFLIATVSIASALTLNSCGLVSSDENPATAFNLNGNGYSVVTPGTLLHNGSSLSGSGAIVFRAPLKEVRSNNSYALTFALDDSGKLELVANATAQLASGVTIRVERIGNALTVSALAGGASVPVLTTRPAKLDPTKTMTLQVDIHNEETPAHVILWDSTEFTEEAAAGNLPAPATGAGMFWGLVLENAVVSSATLSDAKISD